MVRNTEFSISGSTRIAGVIGWPVKQTLSPAMQNTAFQYYGLDVVYLPLEVPAQGLRSLMLALKQLNAVGVNVTIPYKEKIIPFLDECAVSAKQIGAVNTVVFKNNCLIGHNTDGFGFLASLKGMLVPRGKQVVLVGAGGAGRAVAISLASAGVKQLTIVDVDFRRLNKLIRDVKKSGYPQVRGMKPGTSELRERLQQSMLLVNATPLGLKPTDPLPIPEQWMPKRICVMDLVYGKQLTSFLQLAKRKNNQVIPGWKMLLYQGAEAFRLWTGKKPPLDRMQQALVSAGGLKTI